MCGIFMMNKRSMTMRMMGGGCMMMGVGRMMMIALIYTMSSVQGYIWLRMKKGRRKKCISMYTNVCTCNFLKNIFEGTEGIYQCSLSGGSLTFYSGSVPRGLHPQFLH